MVRSFIESLRQVQEGSGAGLEPQRVIAPGEMENRETPVPLGSRPVAYTWMTLGRPALGSNALLAEGSGDALFSSLAYDEVWAATMRALTKGYEILSSDKDSGHIIAQPVAVSNADPASASLDILVEKRGTDVGVNIHVQANMEIPLAERTYLYKSLFEDIAIILSVGVGGGVHLLS